MFEEFGRRAERTGAVLLTAFGYDYVGLANLENACANAGFRRHQDPAPS